MRQMYLNAMIYGLGSHIAGWRLPDIDPHAATHLSYWIDLAQKAEKGGFDAIFIGDILALSPAPHYQVTGSLDPLVTLSALATVTQNIGLIGTASTTFEHPFHLARIFASLDHISNGRAGWNIVTSSKLSEARNFGRDALAPTEERYARAEDVVNAVNALWESWKPGARVADKDSGLFLDTLAVKNTNYRGSYTRSIGPLTVPRSPQGRPLLGQGGASPLGRRFAAHYADLVFTTQTDMLRAADFYREIKKQATSFKRDAHVRILPGLVPVIGRTREEAQNRYKQLNDLVLPGIGLSRLSSALEIDLSSFDEHQPLPAKLLARADIETLPSLSRLILDDARRHYRTIKDMVERYNFSRGHVLVIGTPDDIADEMQNWFENDAADGFNILFPILPHDLETFTKTVIPILEKRGLYKTTGKPSLLRERFNLPIDHGNINILKRSHSEHIEQKL